jgi:hypothetical protein
LFSKLREFVECAEACGNLLPAGDTRGQRRIYILKRLLGRSARGGVVRLANAVEDAACFGFAGGGVVAGFEAEEGVFEGEVEIIRLEPQGFAELVAGGFAVAGFQQCVGKVLADIGAAGGECGSAFEVRYRGVIVVPAQFVEGFGQRLPGGIVGFLSQRGGGNQAESGEANWSLPLALVGPGRGNSHGEVRISPRLRPGLRQVQEAEVVAREVVNIGEDGRHVRRVYAEPL